VHHFGGITEPRIEARRTHTAESCPPRAVLNAGTANAAECPVGGDLTAALTRRPTANTDPARIGRRARFERKRILAHL
jgi:hypothetical protein